MKRLLIVCAIACSSAQAEFFTGNDLLTKMQSSSLIEQSLAMGYVAGVADSGTRVTHCPPKNSTVGQTQDMVRNYLESSPANRHFSADSLILNFLKIVWPCANRQGGTNL